MLGHDHRHGLAKGSGARLGRKGTGFEQDQVEDVDTGQEDEVNCKIIDQNWARVGRRRTLLTHSFLEHETGQPRHSRTRR